MSSDLLGNENLDNNIIWETEFEIIDESEVWDIKFDAKDNTTKNGDKNLKEWLLESWLLEWLDEEDIDPELLDELEKEWITIMPKIDLD